jgi:RecB family exonuclease
MRAVDNALAPARDARLMGADLATAIRQAPLAKLIELLGASSVRSRWILNWDPQDLVWWKALDEVLGDVHIALPWFDKRLEGSRERDPLEVIADGVLKYMEAAPETEMIAAVLGDLASVAPTAADVQNVRVGRATDSAEQARLVAHTVKEALRGGARVERIAIAYPSRDERTLRPLRQALGDAGVVFHDALGAPPRDVPVVAAALQSIQAAETKDRVTVARLLRSGYIDAPRALGNPDMSFRDAERVLERLARRLETRATAVGETPEERLVATAASDHRGSDAASTDHEHARRVASLLRSDAKARLERVREARRIFTDLGLAARAGRGALATFARDEAPSGVDRAERLAVARDVRAWEVLEDSLDAYEAAVADARQPVDAEVFLLELGDLLDASAMLPGAGRAGAVRIVRLADVAGDELDLLVVVDANNGLLPRDQRPVSLVTESLEERVKMGGAGERAARDLAALAVGVADAKAVVLVTTAADDGDAPAQPARAVVSAMRAGAGQVVAPAAVRHGERADVARRADRERAREAFFLDPRRVESPLAGTLTPSAAIAGVVTPETGGVQARPLAVTSIERFAQCPFKGYAHAILAAREGEEQRELPDAREEGNLGHEALAAAFMATRVEWPLRPRDAARIMTKGLAAAEEALAKSAGHAPLRAIVRLRVRESVRAVLTRALEDETWDFALAEQAFGRDRKWPEFSARSSSNADLWLRGSVDRIDRAHDGSAVRVIDYKRSKSTVQGSMQSLGEAAIQVPVYAAVARRNLALPATGLYLPTQPRDLAAPSPRPKDDRVAELAAGSPSEIEERIVALAVGARAGRFVPLPVRESECTFCSVSGGCRKPRFAMEPVEDEDLEKEAT